ncbi:hypothetical protein BJ912DRAFT_1069061 [Pholiota molesta]|nr:hypothetical protein BJ912DRAFT_1069061 [Pholiota molesta]
MISCMISPDTSAASCLPPAVAVAPARALSGTSVRVPQPSSIVACACTPPRGFSSFPCLCSVLFTFTVTQAHLAPNIVTSGVLVPSTVSFALLVSAEGSSAYQDEYDETLIRRCAPKPEDAARLEVLFPRPPPPSFPILSEIGARKQSSILAISNLPVFYHWVDVLAWLRSALNLVNRPHVERVLRSQEDGFQVFWVKLRNPTEAATLRGLLHDRRVAGCPLLRVDFVSGDVYSARCTAHRDAWSPVFGMEIENRPRTTGTIYDRVGLVDPADRPADAPAVSDPFPAKDFLDRFDDPPPVLADPPEASSSSLPLADRLTPPCRTRKRNRKPKRSRQGLDPADGGLCDAGVTTSSYA